MSTEPAPSLDPGLPASPPASPPSPPLSVGHRLVELLPGFGTYIGVGMVIALVAWGIYSLAVKHPAQLMDPKFIRGLITIIFALSTMSIAVILACAGVFKDPLPGDDRDNGLPQRFQRGKEILALLLGIFGTIIGYYFNSASEVLPLARPSVPPPAIPARDPGLPLAPPLVPAPGSGPVDGGAGAAPSGTR